MSEIKVGDIINYVFYSNLKIIGEDKKHFIMQDKYGNEVKIFKTLINKYGQKVGD